MRWYGVLALLLSWIPAWGGEKERPMTDFQVSVDKVAAFEKGAGQGDAELKLQDGTTCLISRGLPHFDVWARLVEKSKEFGWSLYVACDPPTRQVKVLLPTTAHDVESVQPEGDHLKVRFRKSHAIHVLKSTRPRYEENKRALDTALSSGQQVLVVTDPREMEIVDVRLAPASPSPTPTPTPKP